MAAATGLTIVKRFNYRGDPNEEWSNKYWLTGAPPQTSADWQLLFNSLSSLERKLYPPSTHVVAGYGYDDNTVGAHAVWSVEYAAGSELAGQYVTTAQDPDMAGDQAAVVQWKTERKNSRGKWIYLRKYFHAGETASTSADTLAVAYSAALTTFANELFTPAAGIGRQIRSQKQDETLQSHEVLPYVTTRTLHRRGKRP